MITEFDASGADCVDDGGVVTTELFSPDDRFWVTLTFSADQPGTY